MLKISDMNGKIIESHAADFRSPFNIGVVKVDYSGNVKNIYAFLSEEPRYINECELTKDNTVNCKGRKGDYNVTDGMNFYLRKQLQSSWPDAKSQKFYLEFDSNGKILKTNGGN